MKNFIKYISILICISGCTFGRFQKRASENLVIGKSCEELETLWGTHFQNKWVQDSLADSGERAEVFKTIESSLFTPNNHLLGYSRQCVVENLGIPNQIFEMDASIVAYRYEIRKDNSKWNLIPQDTYLEFYFEDQIDTVFAYFLVEDFKQINQIENVALTKLYKDKDHTNCSRFSESVPSKVKDNWAKDSLGFRGKRYVPNELLNILDMFETKVSLNCVEADLGSADEYSLHRYYANGGETSFIKGYYYIKPDLTLEGVECKVQLVVLYNDVLGFVEYYYTDSE